MENIYSVSCRRIILDEKNLQSSFQQEKFVHLLKKKESLRAKGRITLLLKCNVMHSVQCSYISAASNMSGFCKVKMF